MEPSSTIEINLTALDENLASWRAVLAPGSDICAVIKGDAYGLGAAGIGRRLAAGGVKMAAVYSMAQAAELVTANLQFDMLVLMPVEELLRSDPLYRAAVAGKLHLTVHGKRQLEQIEVIGTTYGVRMPVHVEVDTGMSRLGMSIAEADEIIPYIQSRKYLRLAGLFTHPAAAASDVEFTDKQHALFQSLLERHASRLAGVTTHFAGTSAALRDTRYHPTMVRLGLGLLGYHSPIDEGVPTIDPLPALRPVMRWVSRVVHTKQVPPRTSVGYQRTFMTKRATRLGIVPVGHADGYPVALSNKAVVRVGPELREAEVRGMVNMDQIIVDLTDVPGELGVGAEVELVSDDTEAPNSLPRLADLAKSHCYEMLCRLSPRLQKRYILKNAKTGAVGHVATV